MITCKFQKSKKVDSIFIISNVAKNINKWIVICQISQILSQKYYAMW